jgi:hypothetical protein
MAKILKHGKYYDEETGKLNPDINVLCPECMQKISLYITALLSDNELPCLCHTCGCEFIPTEEDVVENEEHKFMNCKED